MEYTYDLATPADDAAIRRLLATTPMPGSVAVTYEREPAYFLGCSTLGQRYHVLVARSQPAGDVAGVACRAVRPLFVNGSPQEIGYLSQLRVDARFRGRGIVSRGFHALRSLHERDPVAGYLAAITAENAVARGILVDHPHRHLPIFRPIADVHTLALILRPRRTVAAAGVEVARGSADVLDEIVAFLQQHGAARQFFPVYTVDDFLERSRTRGFAIDDFFVARRGGRIMGVIGLWDQSAYKQTVVRGYSDMLRLLRPVYNIGARLSGISPLPAIGTPLRYAYASFVCVARDDRDVFRMLLREVANTAAARGYAYLMLGLAAGDPFLAEARRYAHIPYHSQLYTVVWRDQGDFHARLDGRLPFIDIATL